MTRFANIVCATDLTDASTDAVWMAEQLALASEASLLFVHAFHVGALVETVDVAMPTDAVATLRADAERTLSETSATAREHGLARVTSCLCDGHPTGALLEVLCKERADLVVLGTHGRLGLPRLILGSVAEQILRDAPCSAMVVRESERPIRRVLCHVDFTAAAWNAAVRAAELAADELVLLATIDPPTAREGLDAAEVTAQHRLDAWSHALLPMTDARIHTDVRIGPAPEQTLAALDERDYDLVVVDHGGRAGVRITRRAPCSVLVSR